MVLVRLMTAATAAISLACLFIEMLCYVLGRLKTLSIEKSLLFKDTFNLYFGKLFMIAPSFRYLAV